MIAGCGLEDFVHTRFVVDNYIATLTLNRPERRNALNCRAYDELESAFYAASADPGIRCVIVTGADPAFCSGDDIGEIKPGSDVAAKRPGSFRSAQALSIVRGARVERLSSYRMFEGRT